MPERTFLEEAWTLIAVRELGKFFKKDHNTEKTEMSGPNSHLVQVRPMLVLNPECLAQPCSVSSTQIALRLIHQNEMSCYVGSAACIDEISTNSKESLKTWFRCRHTFQRHLALGDESHPCFLAW